MLQLMNINLCLKLTINAHKLEISNKIKLSTTWQQKITKIKPETNQFSVTRKVHVESKILDLWFHAPEVFF